MEKLKYLILRITRICPKTTDYLCKRWNINTLSYWDKWKYCIIVFALAVVIACLLLVGASARDMSRDEGVWSYIGGFLWQEHNMPPYQNTVDNKTPGIFMVYAVSNYFFATQIWPPRILSVVVTVTTAFIIYIIATKLYSHKAGIFSMITFGLCMSWTKMSGDAPSVTETYMVFFSTLAFLFIITSLQTPPPFSKKHTTQLFFVGLSLGFAIAFKQIAVFTTLALLIIYYLLARKKGYSFKNSILGIITIISAIAIATVISIIPLLLSGASINDYWEGAWLILLPKTANINLNLLNRLELFVKTFTQNKILVLLPLFILYLIQKDRIKSAGTPYKTILIWLLWDFLGVNASGYYFPHQLRQLMPSLALISGIAIAAFFEEISITANVERRRAFIISLALIALLAIPYETINKVITKTPNKERQVAALISDYTDPTDYVYAWSRGAGEIYLRSKRRSSSKFFNTIFLVDDNALEQLNKDLKLKPPRIFVVWNRDVKPPEKIEDVLKNKYIQVGSINGYTFWMQKEYDWKEIAQKIKLLKDKK